MYADKLLGTNIFPQSVYDLRKSFHLLIISLPRTDSLLKKANGTVATQVSGLRPFVLVSILTYLYNPLRRLRSTIGQQVSLWIEMSVDIH